LKALPREPLAAIQYISRYLRYLGNLRVLGREVQGERRGHLARRRRRGAADGSGYEHGSLTSVLRDWAAEGAVLRPALHQQS
jgi:hypothetical protein